MEVGIWDVGCGCMCVCMRVMALYPNCQMESINGMERKRDGQFHRLGFSGDPRARATLTLTCAQRTCVSGLTSCRSAGCNWNQFHFTMELATNNANNNDNNNNSVPIWHSCTREVSGCAARRAAPACAASQLRSPAGYMQMHGCNAGGASGCCAPRSLTLHKYMNAR